MKICILDAATLGEDLSLSVFDRLGEVRVFASTPADQIADRVRDAEVVILNKAKLHRGNLSDACSLKLICLTATGYDNVDLDYCRERGIAVCNVVGYSTQCVSQLTVAMALSLITKLSEYNAFVSSGAYSECGCANRLTPVFHEIAGKTWGIVGYGNIGKQVARVAEALGCRILVHKRTPELGVDCRDFETLCRESDILSFHTPLNDGTYHMLDEAHIAMLKKGAIVINVARGAVIDEVALAKAIKEDRIGGIGVDVYSVEPMPKDHPFYEILSNPRVCLTPHMAWGGYETRLRLLEEVAKNVEAFLAGERRCRVD